MYGWVNIVFTYQEAHDRFIPALREAAQMVMAACSQIQSAWVVIPSVHQTPSLTLMITIRVLQEIQIHPLDRITCSPTEIIHINLALHEIWVKL